MSDDRLFRQSISLGSILISGRFISKCLDKLIGEYFNIGSFICIILNLHRLLLDFEIASGIFGLLSVIYIF